MPAEVDAEERQARVRHRIDEPANELALLGAQAQVRAAKRHDARIRVGAGRHGQLVGPDARAEDGEASAELTLRVHQPYAALAPLDGRDRATRFHEPALRLEVRR